MSNNLKSFSFCELLKQGKVRIPKIQRDYAQGRTNKKVSEIRKTFVHTLLLVVKGKRPASELDFVYGSNKDDAFEPLDGQQRLTTLFLLHWMMGVDLTTSDKKHSMFSYETRNTSQEFCDELVQHNAFQFMSEAKKMTEIKGDEYSPSKIIRSRDWFKWEWKSDPTILSMLVMIDSIYEEIDKDENDDWKAYQDNLNKITFNLLNLGDFGYSNELFIKMNARGKQLSDFDKLKSTLEEELQIQQAEKSEDGVCLATDKDEEKWRQLMDGAWIDLFWHKYARQTIINTEPSSDEGKQKRLDVATKTEIQFKKLILRLIALQLFENTASTSEVREAAYRIDESQLDNLLSVYTDNLLGLRSEDNHIVTGKYAIIDFQILIGDVNHLLFIDKSTQTYGEITALLPPITHIDNNEKTIFDSFLDTKVPNDVELIFYAMLKFLRAFPINSNGDILVLDEQINKQWLTNLHYWVRAMRNILLNDNTNQRIDKKQLALEATESIKIVVEDLINFVNNNELNIYNDETVILRFLGSSDKTYKRLDNQSLNEEREKARLRLNDSKWNDCFDRFESNPYLWGQIRCLLNWSCNDINSFVDYGERLVNILDVIRTDSKKYYCAILAFDPDCWRDSNRLYVLTKERDNSFKRYLREYARDDQSYGKTLKTFIDYWKNNHANLSVIEFFDSLISEKMNTVDPWIRAILKYPVFINYARDKRLYESKGHVILAQRITEDSHCFDPIFLYFMACCEQRNHKGFKFHDSKGEYAHAFEYKNVEHTYLIQWEGFTGNYSLKIDENSPESYSAQGILDIMEQVFNSTSENVS